MTTDLTTPTPTDLVSRLEPRIPRRNSLDMTTFQMIQALAPSFHICRWYGLASPEQAIVVMAKAVDLGIPFTAAFDFFDVIEGRPALKPVGALALIHRDGRIDLTIDDSKADRCTVTMRRRDTGFAHTVTYTVQDARDAGLIKDEKAGSAWKRFVTDMLRNRAVGRCARIVAPDILGGCYLSTDFESGIVAYAPAPGASFNPATGEILEGEVQS